MDVVKINKVQVTLVVRTGSTVINAGGASNPRRFEITLTAFEVVNKQLTLIPVATDIDSIVARWVGGGTLVEGHDYNIIGNNVIDWTGLSLDGLAQVGDIYEFNYI